jgi:hypothetical protein
MKIAKDYSNVSTVYYRPEMKNCPGCGNGLRRSHRVWSKYIIQLVGTIYAVSMGYRCSSDSCSLDVVYRSAEAESLSLKYYSFGMDVIARIGEMRFSRNQTLGEIHSDLLESISISEEREVQYLIETYMLLMAGVKQERSYLDDVIFPEGIILSIDGIQPEKGNEVLYILRDVLSGEVLHAENLLSSDNGSIKGIIQPVIDLGYPILGVVSDGQRSIRVAVMDLLPDVPYQLCHYHYLDDISVGLEDKDRKLKTKLKKGIRDIRTVERRIGRMEDSAEKDVLNDFTIAIRTTALQRSVYPFNCGGIRIYDQLMDIEATLMACQKVKDHPLLIRLREIVTRHRPYGTQYEEADMLLTMVKRIASLIDPDNFPEDSEEKRKRRLVGYMGYVAKLERQHPDLAEDLNQIVKTTKSFLPHLFAYLRCPGLPVTNNDLEVFHRKVKTMHRRRTGRKSSHDYIIRYGRFAVYQMGMDCQDRLKALSYPKLKALKEQLESARRRYSKMYRVRHNRPEFLMQLLGRWTTVAIPAPAPT